MDYSPLAVKLRRYGFLTGYVMRNRAEQREMRAIGKWLREAGEDPGWAEYGPWWQGPRKRSRAVRIRETRARARRRRALMRCRRAVLREPGLEVAARKAVRDVHVHRDDSGYLSAWLGPRAAGLSLVAPRLYQPLCVCGDDERACKCRGCQCPACEIPF